MPLAIRVAREIKELSHWSPFAGDADLVFAHPHTGRPIDRSKLLKRFKAAVKTAGVGKLEEILNEDGVIDLKPLTRLYDLRHTFGTRCAAAGVPMRTLQEWMGHRDFKMTLIYADYAPGAHEAEMIERAFSLSGNAESGESKAAHRL